MTPPPLRIRVGALTRPPRCRRLAYVDRRDKLLNTMRAKASWRREKAIEYSDDHISRHRSNRAMTALQRAARFVESMPADDRDLEWLRYADEGRTHLALSEESSELLSRFGMDRGAWQAGGPTERQIRNLLRRLGGAEGRARAQARRDAS